MYGEGSVCGISTDRPFRAVRERYGEYRLVKAYNLDGLLLSVVNELGSGKNGCVLTGGKLDRPRCNRPRKGDFFTDELVVVTRKGKDYLRGVGTGVNTLCANGIKSRGNYVGILDAGKDFAERIESDAERHGLFTSVVDESFVSCKSKRALDVGDVDFLRCYYPLVAVVDGLVLGNRTPCVVLGVVNLKDVVVSVGGLGVNLNLCVEVVFAGICRLVVADILHKKYFGERVCHLTLYVKVIVKHDRLLCAVEGDSACTCVRCTSCAKKAHSKGVSGRLFRYGEVVRSDYTLGNSPPLGECVAVYILGVTYNYDVVSVSDVNSTLRGVRACVGGGACRMGYLNKLLCICAVCERCGSVEVNLKLVTRIYKVIRLYKRDVGNGNGRSLDIPLYGVIACAVSKVSIGAVYRDNVVVLGSFGESKDNLSDVCARIGALRVFNRYGDYVAVHGRKLNFDGLLFSVINELALG